MPKLRVSLVASLSITIGFVSGLWMIIAWALNETGVEALMVPAWAAFIGMPLYFASGGGAKKLGVTFTGLAGGAIMSIVMTLIADALDVLPGPLPIAIGVGVGSYIVVAYSRVSWIPYVPAGFAGASASFAFGSAAYHGWMIVALVIAMFSGAFLGFTADVWGHAWIEEPEVPKNQATSAAGAAGEPQA